MIMTRKDYVKIAQVLADNRPSRHGDDLMAWRLIVEGMSKMLATDNPRFNSTIFLDACKGDKQ